ncbi:MAG: MFS transporter [Syntrophales bacterium]|nr:MFS transporter [Syntrophales bacterium]
MDEKLSKRTLISWCLYDFANSSYAAVILAVVFQVYYIENIVGNANGSGDLWWGRAISTSMFIISLISPFLGGIADFAGWRKQFLILFTLICAGSVVGFSFLTPGAVLLGFVLIVLANIGMEGGVVFYNSFLPRIASTEFQGRISGWGFAVGYAGSIVSLLLALPLAKAGYFNVVWLMVAAFFVLFSIPSFLFLPQDTRTQFSPLYAGRLGVIKTYTTLSEMWKSRDIRRFFLAYLLYEDGVNTVIVFSASFASATFSFTHQELIVLFLLIQVTALIGALALSRPTDEWGPKKVVILSLILWSSVSSLAYFVYDKAHFWILAVVAGMGLGSVQSATRALFARFVPEGKEAEYFGVYSLVGKTSAIIGPLLFGYLSATFGSQRPAILSVTLFFLLGLIILFPLKTVEKR